MKNIEKTNKICYCLGGGEFLGGEISPLKALKKTLLSGFLTLNAESILPHVQDFLTLNAESILSHMQDALTI